MQKFPFMVCDYSDCLDIKHKGHQIYILLKVLKMKQKLILIIDV